MPAIRVRDLSKVYRVRTPSPRPSLANFLRPPHRDIIAVDKVSFAVEAGEALAFLGPNGAGKSTTIKMLTGILYPSSGDIDVLGLNPQRDRQELGFRIGSVFGQKSQLWYHLSARDSFSLLGAVYEIERAELRRRVGDLTERFALADFFDMPVRKLSLGQRIRCELAASLLHKPRLLFLDEPTIGLDVVVKQEIRALLAAWNKDEKVTLFLTSHDIGDVEKLCRRAILIHHGRLVLDESIKSLKRQASARKIIGIRYATPLAIAVPGIEPVKRGADSAKYVVAGTDDWQLVIQRLVALGPVADLTVEDEPLENLIADLYRQKAPEATDAPVAG